MEWRENSSKSNIQHTEKSLSIRMFAPVRFFNFTNKFWLGLKYERYICKKFISLIKTNDNYMSIYFRIITFVFR